MKSKKRFMNRFRRLLLWRFRAEDVREILSDYNEFFDVALETGKSEEEIVKELGDPLTIVKNIDQEWKKEKRLYLWSGKVLFFYGIRFFCLCGILFFGSVLINTYDWENSVFLVLPLFLLVFWALLGGNTFSLGLFSNQVTSRKRKLLLLHGIQVMLSLPAFIILLWMLFYPEGIFYVFRNDPSYMGVFFEKWLVALCVVLVFYNLWVIYQYRKLSFVYYGLFIHGFSSIFMIVYFINILHRLSDFNTLQRQLIRCIFIYMEGIVLVFLFFLLLKSRKKEDK